MANSDLGVINEEIFNDTGVSVMVAEIVGENLIITSCNAANAKMTGYSIEELVGCRPKDTTLSSATDITSMQKALDSAASGEPGIFSSRFKRKDGKPFAARCMVSGRFDDAGKITHYIFVATEINPGNPGLRWFGPQGLLVQAEQVGGTGAWRYEFETEELICSENCYALFGLSNSCDTLETLVSLIPHSEHVKLNERVDECRKNGQTFEVDCTYYRYDGSRRDGLIAAQPEFDSEGNVIAIIGVLRDETEVRALRRRQEMFLQAAKIGFIEIDLDGETVSYSADAGVIIGVGRTPGKIALDAWKKRVHPEDYEGALQNYHEGIKSRKSFTRRYRFKVESGEYRWIEIRATTRPLPDSDSPAIFGTIADVHAEVIADQEITEIRTRLDLAVDSAGLGLWSWDLRSPDGDAMSWSPHMRGILGLKPGDGTSWKILESLIHPEEREEVSQKILASAESVDQGKFKIEHRFIRPDGKVIWVENRGLARHDREGRAIAIAGALMDITERKRAEADLVESEQRFHDAASITGECIFELDANGCVTYISEAAQPIYGQSPEELMGKTPNDFNPGQIMDGERWLANAHKHCGWKDIECEIGREDGSTRWIMVNGRALKGTDDTIIGFRGSISDITERHRSIEQLVQTERRVNDVVRIAGGVIFDLDTEGNITFMSDNAKTLFSVESADLIGKPTYTLAPDLEPRHQEWLMAIANSDGGLESEIRMTPLDGSSDLWMRTTCRTLTDDEGKLIGFRGIAFDETARKQAALEILNAKKAAEAAAEERARFLSTMSHEIRTPLNAMIGMTDLLLDMSQSDEQKHLTTSANTAGKHLLGLVNDILDFSKLDAGKLVVEQTSFDLRAETMAVQNMLANSAAEKGLDLKVKVDSDAKGQFIGDPSRIRQILVNLISNALKFTAKGEVSVHIHRAKNQRMRFSVTDTGTGIDKKALPTLFSDFSQADSSITRKFGGTGLGLAICKRLTDVMGGEIGVSSTLGEGSTFWFEIPLQVEKARKSKVKEISTAKNTNADKALKLHILVAEDNPANQLLIKTLLTRMGHTLVITNDGSEAIEAALTESFDLILMDVRMPKLDGVSATRLLREAGCHIPVIALTAHILADEKDRFSAAGMDDWLSKPFDARKLAETMFYWSQKGPLEHILVEEKTG
jgi:PAS domain S-box-containing protein